MNTQQESLREVFPKTRDTLISLIDQRIEQKLGDKFPTKEDFSELKGITKVLAQAQQGTERELRLLARQVGGLSEKLGGSLEDLSYDVLPACLEKYYDIEVAELSRDFIKIGSKQIELNVLGEGIYKKTGKPVIIVGEVKGNITLKKTKKFINTLKAIRPTLKGEVVTLLFGFRIYLDARSLAKKEGIHLFVSYGKEL